LWHHERGAQLVETQGMSRIVVFDRDFRSVGEFQGIVNRAWTMSGASKTMGGSTTTVQIAADDAVNEWLQFGRMVLIEHESLPRWAGMIDTPWIATLPVSCTLYSPEYLPSLRFSEQQLTVSGSFETVLQEIIDLINKDEDMRIRLGTMGDLPSGDQQLTIKQQSLWQTLNDFGAREAVEFAFRAERDENNLLTIYIDADLKLGAETGLYLHDGPGANIQIIDAKIESKIINRIVGIGAQSTNQARIQTAPYFDADSIEIYGLRGTVKQFSSLTLQSSLEAATQSLLKYGKEYYLRINLAVIDSTLFDSMRLGNSYYVHAANIILPGGIRGWSGQMRSKVISYDEKQNVVLTTMDGVGVL
jgi:hypothetical protein